MLKPWRRSVLCRPGRHRTNETTSYLPARQHTTAMGFALADTHEHKMCSLSLESPAAYNRLPAAAGSGGSGAATVQAATTASNTTSHLHRISASVASWADGPP